MMLLSELASIGTDISGFSITASLIYVAKLTKPDLNRSSAPQVKDHVAGSRRAEPTAAWRWIGGATTCARYVRRGAGSSPSSVHCQSSQRVVHSVYRHSART